MGLAYLISHGSAVKWDEIDGKPAIPDAVSDLENDLDFVEDAEMVPVTNAEIDEIFADT